jgi:hypothetical protein
MIPGINELSNLETYEFPYFLECGFLKNGVEKNNSKTSIIYWLWLSLF